MKLIGLAGAAGSGKDTVAEMILERAPGVRMAFADPLKRAASEIFGLFDTQMTDRVLKEQVIPFWGLSPRQILQRLGTECIREQFGADTWLKRAEKELELRSAQLSASSVVVFTDVRFTEEAQWIIAQGGVVISVFRPDVQAVSEHSSEQGIPSWLLDYSIPNDYGLDELRSIVTLFLPTWLEKATMTRKSA